MNTALMTGKRGQWLTQEELVNLLECISVTLKQRIAQKPGKHSIMELEGLGADIWNGIDAQEYVRSAFS